jgi:NADH-quinone oxidoreductase subunit M
VNLIIILKLYVLLVLYNFLINSQTSILRSSEWVLNIEKISRIGVLKKSISIDFITFLFVSPLIICIIIYFFFKSSQKFESFLILINCILIILVLSTGNFFFFLLLFEVITVSLFISIFMFGYTVLKIRAAVIFIVYSAFGAALIIVSISLTLIFWNQGLKVFTTNFCYFLIFAAFAIKIPLFPFFEWLPEAHSEASSAGSVLLTSGVLKIGVYGVLRFGITEGIHSILPLVIIMVLSTIIISGFHSIFENNIKKLIALSTLLHIGIPVLLIYLCTNFKFLIFAILILMSHSYISSALFIIAGFFFKIAKSYNLSLFNYNKKSKTNFFLLILCNISIPYSLGFFSELVSLFAIFNYLQILAIFIFCIFSIFVLFISFKIFIKLQKKKNNLI